MTALRMPAAVRAVQDAEAPTAPLSVVLGIDTHKDVHVAAVLDHLGALLGTGEFPATAAGYRQLLDWAGQCGTVVRAGVECTGSYGAGLARYLATQRVAVVEVNQPDRSTRRRRGKTDAIDAEAAARAALSGTARALPKSGDGQVEALRFLRLAKNSAVKARTQALNQLKAVLVNAPSTLREELEPLSTWLLVSRCAELVDPRGDDPAADTAVYTLRLLAQRILRLRQDGCHGSAGRSRLHPEPDRRRLRRGSRTWASGVSRAAPVASTGSRILLKETWTSTATASCSTASNCGRGR
ncbi:MULTISPECIES: IS110 family transposase [Streptomyces]|uniref:Transposase n=2 Tax=Streptomyces TaxID=1883 RepID=A0ABV9IMS7_9ACTN